MSYASEGVAQKLYFSVIELFEMTDYKVSFQLYRTYAKLSWQGVPLLPVHK
jgi:hypothetical protein